MNVVQGYGDRTQANLDFLIYGGVNLGAELVIPADVSDLVTPELSK